MKKNRLDFERTALALLVGTAVSCGVQTPRATDTPADAIQPTDAVQQDATYSISCPPGFNTFIGPPPAGALPFAPLASLGGGAAGTATVLIVARLAQGIGAARMSPAALSSLTDRQDR